MTGFILSPGITPALVSAVSIELPLAYGLGYVLFRTRGLDLAIVLNALLLGAIKIYTDYPDPYDMLVTAGTLASGLAMWGLTRGRAWVPSRKERTVLAAVAWYAIAAGVLKIVTDPYDPFDTFLSASAIIAGGFVLQTLRQGRSMPRSAGLAQ